MTLSNNISCASWPFVYLLWKNVYSITFPFKKWVIFLLLSCKSYLYIWPLYIYKAPIYISRLKRLSSCSVSDSGGPHRQQPTKAPPSLGFSRQEHWNGLPFPSHETFNKVQFIYFSFVLVLLVSYLRIPCQNKVHETLLLFFSSKSLIGLAHTFLSFDIFWVNICIWSKVWV